MIPWLGVYFHISPLQSYSFFSFFLVYYFLEDIGMYSPHEWWGVMPQELLDCWHELFVILLHGSLALLYILFIDSIIYLYQYELVAIYFMLWVIIQCYFLYFVIKLFQFWPLGLFHFAPMSIWYLLIIMICVSTYVCVTISLLRNMRCFPGSSCMFPVSVLEFYKKSWYILLQMNLATKILCILCASCYWSVLTSRPFKDGKQGDICVCM